MLNRKRGEVGGGGQLIAENDSGAHWNDRKKSEKGKKRI